MNTDPKKALQLLDRHFEARFAEMQADYGNIRQALMAGQAAQVALDAQQAHADKQPEPQKNAPPKIGETWPGHGGIYAGQIRYPGGEQYHLIIHPDGINDIAWGTKGHEIDIASSQHDGHANTYAMIASGHCEAMAQALQNLSAVDGKADYYLPAISELNVMVANLGETLPQLFHWSSSQCSANKAWTKDCEYGSQRICNKDGTLAVRAVRRELVIE